MMHCQRTSNQ